MRKKFAVLATCGALAVAVVGAGPASAQSSPDDLAAGAGGCYGGALGAIAAGPLGFLGAPAVYQACKGFAQDYVDTCTSGYPYPDCSDPTNTGYYNNYN